jgi:hypothetical protein
VAISAEEIGELRLVCPAAQEMSEGNIAFVYLPGLKVGANVVDGLLCLSPHSGYPTRLFLSVPIAGKGANWTTHTILSRTWHSWSWNYVLAGQRPAEILVQHLRALR